jgi:hypothetical protein
VADFFIAFLSGLAEFIITDQAAFDTLSFEACMFTVTDGISAECTDAVAVVFPAFLIGFADVVAASIMAGFFKTLLIGAANHVCTEFRNIVALVLKTFLTGIAFLIAAFLLTLIDA